MILNVIFANSVDADRSSLIRVHTVCLYAKIGLKCLQEYSTDDMTTFSDAGFPGILRVIILILIAVNRSYILLGDA